MILQNDESSLPINTIEKEELFVFAQNVQVATQFDGGRFVRAERCRTGRRDGGRVRLLIWLIEISVLRGLKMRLMIVGVRIRIKKKPIIVEWCDRAGIVSDKEPFRWCRVRSGAVRAVRIVRRTATHMAAVQMTVRLAVHMVVQMTVQMAVQIRRLAGRLDASRRVIRWTAVRLTVLIGRIALIIAIHFVRRVFVSDVALVCRHFARITRQIAARLAIVCSPIVGAVR